MLLLLRRSLVLFLSLYITFAIAPSPPGWEFSSQSTARGVGMICNGHFPEDYAPDFLSDPNDNPFAGSMPGPFYYQNLIQLCARQDWGGRELNVGGRCSALTEDPFTILFDYRGYRHISFIRDDRLALYCYSKCWCTGGESGSVPLVDRVPLTIPTTTINEVYDPWSRQKANVDVSPDDKFLSILFLFESSSQQLSLPVYAALLARYTGTPEGRIKCEGGVPRFPIPLPDGTFYNSLLEVCAAGIYGGSSRGNFGGFCRLRNQYGQMNLLAHGSVELSYVSGWSGVPQFWHSSMTLAYCVTHCHCDPSPEDLDIDINRSGIDFKTLASSHGIEFSIKSLGQNHIEFVKTPSQRPAQPEQHPVSTVQINPDLSEPPNQQQQCPLARTCHGSTDCNGCVCHVNPTKSTVDPRTRKMVFFQGICNYWMSPALAMMASRIRKKNNPFQRLYKDTLPGSAGLLGRAVGLAEDEKGENNEFTEARAKISPTWCACNASYVSVGCCQTTDGLTWEETELHLGWLA